MYANMDNTTQNQDLEKHADLRNKYSDWPNHKEAAEILRVSKDSLQALRESNRNPFTYVKLGRNILYKPSDLESYMDASLVKAKVDLTKSSKQL